MTLLQQAQENLPRSDISHSGTDLLLRVGEKSKQLVSTYEKKHRVLKFKDIFGVEWFTIPLEWEVSNV